MTRTTELVLLGTRGGPRPSLVRANASNLVRVGGAPYLVDCGLGVTRRLLEAGVALPSLRHIFITHHHSDHTLELGPLLHSAWASGLASPVDVYGPPPLRPLIEGMLHAMETDIAIRMADEGRPDLARLIRVHEFEAPATVLELPGLTVRAIPVIHPPLTHAYAYRFDAPDRSIVLSGDTAFCPALAEFAQGSDVLLHEAMHPGGLDRLCAINRNAPRLREHLLASHTTTEEVGRIAAQAGVNTLVLNHLVPGEDSALTEAHWLEGPRRHFAGRVLLGQDLMVL